MRRPVIVLLVASTLAITNAGIAFGKAPESVTAVPVDEDPAGEDGSNPPRSKDGHGRLHRWASDD